MKKSFLLIILLFIFSCSESNDLKDDTSISDINIDLSDIDVGTGIYQEDIIENTTDEEIDELIDILFETNFN